MAERTRAGVLFLALLVAAAAASDAADPRAAAEKFVRPLVDAEYVVGIAVGVVTEKGTHVFGYGKTARGGRTPDGDTVFEIGSVTKAFTALLLADMAERKLIGLDDPVGKLLPESVTVPTRGGKAITLAMLATHTSGLPRMPSNFRPKDARNPYADYTVEQMHAFLSKHTLRRDPGARYEYSNVGAGLLGHALARRAGVSYEQLVLGRICTPLGMADTRIALPPAMKKRLAQGHDRDGNPVSNWDITGLAGCGALRSTVNDLLKFLAANLGLRKTPLASAMAKTHTARTKVGRGTKIALGWHIWLDDRIVWHNGGTGGYASFVGFVKDKRTGVVVLANSAFHGQTTAAGRLLLRALTGQKAEPLKLRRAIGLDPKQLDAVVGRYQIGPGRFIIITRKGSRLLAQVTGQPAVGIYPASPTRFFYKVVSAQITFHRNGAGRITRLIIHQGGKDTPATRAAQPKRTR